MMNGPTKGERKGSNSLDEKGIRMIHPPPTATRYYTTYAYIYVCEP